VKVFIAVVICKVLYFVGKLVGKGSSLPGQIALKVCPDVLGSLKLPKIIIAVTGSNGKTSTAELIAHALEQSGLSVGLNHEGSNQTEGVATLLLRVAAFSGAIGRDALVLECDERYARKIFQAVKPTALIVTNLCRDQLSRNGHFEFIGDSIRAAIEAAGTDTKLILNADDPYVSALAKVGQSPCPPPDVVWFGVGADLKMGDFDFKVHSCYDDGAFCPICKSRMSYDYRVAGHYGAFRCSSCGFARHEPDAQISSINYDSGEAVISLPGLPSVRSHLAISSLVGAYNLAAAIAAVTFAGVSLEDAAQALNNYQLKGGRTMSLSFGGREGVLLISKHENSFAYNQSLSWAVSQGKPCTVLILVDAISRKYYTSETSWFWDIDVDILSHDIVENIILAGRYVNELAARFAMSSVAQDKIWCVEEVGLLREFVLSNASGVLYAVTCFSDKEKLLRGLRSC